MKIHVLSRHSPSQGLLLRDKAVDDGYESAMLVRGQGVCGLTILLT